jgi:hypothetical protein
MDAAGLGYLHIQGPGYFRNEERLVFSEQYIQDTVLPSQPVFEVQQVESSQYSQSDSGLWQISNHTSIGKIRERTGV